MVDILNEPLLEEVDAIVVDSKLANDTNSNVKLTRAVHFNESSANGGIVGGESGTIQLSVAEPTSDVGLVFGSRQSKRGYFIEGTHWFAVDDVDSDTRVGNHSVLEKNKSSLGVMNHTQKHALMRSKTDSWELESDTAASKLRVRGRGINLHRVRGTNREAHFQRLCRTRGDESGRAANTVRDLTVDNEDTYTVSDVENESVFDDAINFEETFQDRSHFSYTHARRSTGSQFSGTGLKLHSDFLQGEEFGRLDYYERAGNAPDDEQTDREQLLLDLNGSAGSLTVAENSLLKSTRENSNVFSIAPVGIDEKRLSKLDHSEINGNTEVENVSRQTKIAGKKKFAVVAKIIQLFAALGNGSITGIDLDLDNEDDDDKEVENLEDNPPVSSRRKVMAKNKFGAVAKVIRLVAALGNRSSTGIDLDLDNDDKEVENLEDNPPVSPRRKDLAKNKFGALAKVIQLVAALGNRSSTGIDLDLDNEDDDDNEVDNLEDNLPVSHRRKSLAKNKFGAVAKVIRLVAALGNGSSTGIDLDLDNKDDDDKMVDNLEDNPPVSPRRKFLAKNKFGAVAKVIRLVAVLGNVDALGSRITNTDVDLDLDNDDNEVENLEDNSPVLSQRKVMAKKRFAADGKVSRLVSAVGNGTNTDVDEDLDNEEDDDSEVHNLEDNSPVSSRRNVDWKFEAVAKVIQLVAALGRRITNTDVDLDLDSDDDDDSEVENLEDNSPVFPQRRVKTKNRFSSLTKVIRLVSAFRDGTNADLDEDFEDQLLKLFAEDDSSLLLATEDGGHDIDDNGSSLRSGLSAQRPSNNASTVDGDGDDLVLPDLEEDARGSTLLDEYIVGVDSPNEENENADETVEERIQRQDSNPAEDHEDLSAVNGVDDEVRDVVKEATKNDVPGSQEPALTPRPAKKSAHILEDSDTDDEDDFKRRGKKSKKVKKVPVNGLSPETRGDEDDIFSEQIFSKEDDSIKIPDDFFYDYNDHVSKAAITDDSGLPMDLLTLHHSFGYECLKRANLYVLAKDVIAFAVGNYVQIVNVQTKQHTYIRSTSGLGIGAITVHPNRKYLAVAEKGIQPNINVYAYPSLGLYRILRGGTERSYSYADFSPDGKLLASIGGDPDYMLTLWNWKQERIVLRSKAYSQDVFRVTFSTELEGQLTSSGIGHIRFWKMASTFTGLKLQGQLGKFGKKEISDVEGYIELPDGKVLSGCENGNMLMWDGGLIKVEISRKNHKPCHLGSIQQIIMDEGELMTIGIDGYIRVWDFETIDSADTTDDAGIFEMEPMNELKVGPHVQLKSMVKSCDPDETTIWYAQDANGSIWRLDLLFSFTSTPPECVLSYHAGAINSCCTSPLTSLVATTGADSTVRVFDYISKAQLCSVRYNTPGSTMIWLPQSIDSKGSTILVGFGDGVVRILNVQKVEGVDQHGRKLTDKSEILLRQALKPHKQQVTCMAIDRTGDILATGSKDSTVFFFNISDNYEPIGFVNVHSPVTHLDWSPPTFKRNTLLVCCADGTALEIECPDPEKIDSSRTYEITDLKTRTHQFKSVKSVMLHDDELAKKVKQEEEKIKEEVEEASETEKESENTKNDHEDENSEEEKEVEELWVPYIPPKPSPIRHGFHAKDEGKFWLSMGDYDTGYLYECEFLEEEAKSKLSREQLYEPTRIIPIHNCNDYAVGTMLFSQSNKHLFLGLDDGTVRIQPLHGEDAGLMGPYWSLTVHDNNYGVVTRLAMSHDCRYLFSVGLDGNFFSFLVMDDKRLEKKVVETAVAIPSAKKELTELQVEDILDVNTNSIEAAKQRAEYENKLMIAEQKKFAVRESIQMLRDQFQKLATRNSLLPPHLAITRKEFEMDPEIMKELLRQKTGRIEVVNKEMSWENAKYEVTLRKLQSRFKDCVAFEMTTVKAFRGVHEVSTFRLAKLSSEHYKLKRDIELKEAKMREMLHLRLPRSTHGSSDADVPASGSGVLESANAKLITTSVRGSAGERILKALAKVDEKKKRRAVRVEQWHKLNSSKPDANYEDPEEVAAIKDAEEHTGDYKLKSAEDYVVPEHLRMNTEKAKMKLLNLREQMYIIKRNFNLRLIALRDKKMKVIEEIRQLALQVQKIQSLLGPNLVKPIPEIPVMHPCETPEKKYEYSKDILMKFKEKVNYKSQITDESISNAVFGIFRGSSRSLLTPGELSDILAKSTTTTTKQKDASKKEELQREQVRRFSIISDYTQWVDDSKLNDLQKQIKQTEQIRLIYKRDHLLEDIEDLLTNFDAELRLLRHEKFQLDIDLKHADCRQIVVYQEFLLLKEFEKTENVLSAALNERLSEKSKMENMITEVTTKLDLKKRDIERLIEKDGQLWNTFKESVSDSKFADFLTKVFKKKMKRSKRRSSEAGEEESESESEDDLDLSESEEESESEVGQLDLEVCPPGCDQSLYDSACLLREKRLDIEESLVDERKTRDALAKEIDGLQRRAKAVEGLTRTAVQELEAFQLQKQRHINELDVVVVLKLHQIEYVKDEALPSDLSQCLVFESRGLSNLHRRIQELEHERIVQKKQKRDAKMQHVQLVKDRRLFNQRITRLSDECDKLMTEKFGRTVDIEKLESVTVNRQIEEIRDQLSIADIECAATLMTWQERINNAKDELTSHLRTNTERLDQMTTLLQEKGRYEANLDKLQKSQGSEFRGTRSSEVDERKRLVQVIQLQASEIEELKNEIAKLSRKDGQVVPPANTAGQFPGSRYGGI